jgi:uncharacterized protein (TIGR03000 family)
MRSVNLNFGRVVLTVAVVILTANAVWAQAQAPTTVTPRAPGPPGDSNPISPPLFGPRTYPYWATAPSNFPPAPSPSQLAGGFYRGPSLGSTVAPLPTLGLSHSMRRQPALGAFIGFSSASSLRGGDAGALLPGGDFQPTPDNRAHITLHVPADAQVWFDGKETKQKGTVRQYESPKLAVGKKYHYEIRVRWMKEGKPIEEKRRIEVEARDWLRFDLARPSTP